MYIFRKEGAFCWFALYDFITIHGAKKKSWLQMFEAPSFKNDLD